MGIRNGRPAQHIQSEFDGFLMIHRYEDQAHIIDVIRAHRPMQAVELGTAAGGFAALLASTLLRSDGMVLSVDKTQDPGIGAELRRLYPNLTLLEADVLTTALPAVVEALQRPGGSLLYTDNGNKRRELELYAPLMGPRALIGTHDYGTEVDEAWVEPFMASLGYTPHQHARFEALASEFYWDSLTRFWTRP